MRKPFVFLWFFFVIGVIFYWIYLPVLTRYRDLKFEEEKIVRELDELNRKIIVLEEEKNLLKNDMTYLEKVIRDELGLVKPGETVYKFVVEKPKEDPGTELSKTVAGP